MTYQPFHRSARFCYKFVREYIHYVHITYLSTWKLCCYANVCVCICVNVDSLSGKKLKPCCLSKTKTVQGTSRTTLDRHFPNSLLWGLMRQVKKMGESLTTLIGHIFHSFHLKLNMLRTWTVPSPAATCQHHDNHVQSLCAHWPSTCLAYSAPRCWAVGLDLVCPVS